MLMAGVSGASHERGVGRDPTQSGCSEPRRPSAADVTLELRSDWIKRPVRPGGSSTWTELLGHTSSPTLVALRYG